MKTQISRRVVTVGNDLIVNRVRRRLNLQRHRLKPKAISLNESIRADIPFPLWRGYF